MQHFFYQAAQSKIWMYGFLSSHANLHCCLFCRLFTATHEAEGMSLQHHLPF